MVRDKSLYRNESIFYQALHLPFLIEYQKRDNIMSMSHLHYHDSYEIYYLISGERYYFIEEKIYKVQKGTFVLINLKVLHKTINSNNLPHDRFLINFRAEYLRGFTLNINDINMYTSFDSAVLILKLNNEQQSFAEKLMNRMLDESENKKEGYETQLKILLLDLLLFINRHYKLTETNNSHYSDSIYDRVVPIVSYINKNYMNEIDLPHIAKKFYISQSYLCIIFKRITGFTFVEYLNSVRIREAQEILLSSKQSITQIYGQIGFSNATHFGRVFKTITGISPMQFRKLKTGR